VGGGAGYILRGGRGGEGGDAAPEGRLDRGGHDLTVVEHAAPSRGVAQEPSRIRTPFEK
jgi:hypothetical protein